MVGFIGACVTGVGTRIADSGMLLREGDGHVLRRDGGGRWQLDLHRVAIDIGDVRVRVSGVVVAPGLLDVDSLVPEQA